MSSPFDRALEMQRLMAAADAFALEHGRPGSPAYRAAWLQARRRHRAEEAPEPSRSDAPAIDDAVAVLRLAMERAMLVDGASMGYAQVVDPDTRALRIVAHSGLPKEFLDFFGFVEPTAKTPCAGALANACAIWVADAIRSPMFAGSPALEVTVGTGSRGVASVPVVSPDGDVIAMINTHHERPAGWTEQQRLELERLARTTGRILAALPPPRGFPS